MERSKEMPSISVPQNLTTTIASIVIIGILFGSSFVVPSSAQVVQENDCTAPLTTTIDANYQGPVAVDAYWVDQGVVDNSASATNPIKKEVGPGEGSSILAVVLNNRGNNPLNSVTAFLNLPAGFAPTGNSKIPQLLQQYNPASKMASNYALASYYGAVSAGGTFILFFDVNVLPTAKVGTFSTNMAVNYKIGVGAAGLNVQSCTSALLEVPLVLPGKVVLDLASDHNYIKPTQSDPITLTVENKGSAPATGVIATITNLGQKGNSGSGGSGTLTLSSTTTNIVNLGANQFALGTIPAGGSANITTVVFPSSSAAGQTQDVTIGISYENAWGAQESISLNTGVVVSPLSPQSLSLTYVGNDTSPVITSGKLSDLSFAVSNNGSNNDSNIVISLVPQSTSVSVVGPSTWTIPNVAPGNRTVLSTSVFAANSLIDTPTAFTLTANYVSQEQAQTNSLTLGAFVVGDIKLQLYDLAVNYVGSTPNLAGSLLNQGSTTGLYTTVQLVKSPILQAIREARMSNHTSQNGTSNAGFQQGQAYGSSSQTSDQSSGGVGQGGDSRGNFGGQGGGGSFGGQGSQRGQNTQQFLGDLTPDSPIPFSIPLNGIGSLQPGSYPVSFEVVYADDLKAFHKVILNGTVSVGRAPQIGPAHERGSILDQLPIPLPMLIGIAIAAVIAAVIVKKIKSKKQKHLKMLAGNDTDIVAAFNDSDKK
ncbi:MAG: hypothetical protein KGH88_04790 [Thaumarchaeota archaeon]|nr:hypothetical protein [Nitrososphaerota archaeon]